MQTRTTLRVMYVALAIAGVQPLVGCSPEPRDAELGIYRGSAERAEQDADPPLAPPAQPVPGASSAAGSAAAAGGAGSAAGVGGSTTGTAAAGAAADSGSGATGGSTATAGSSATGGSAASAAVATAGSGGSGGSGPGSGGAGDGGASGAVDFCATQNDPSWKDWKAILSASAAQICPGECVELTASTTAAPAPTGYAWRKGSTPEAAHNAGESEPLLGPGPHGVCPTQTTTYEVSAFYFACEDFGYEVIASTTIVVTPTCP